MNRQSAPQQASHEPNLSPDPKAMLRKLRRQAARHADAGRVREALYCQQQVTALAPDNSHEFMQLGFLHRKADEIDDATEAFVQASNIAPADPDPHEALAEIYLDTARYDYAIREAKAVLAALPNSIPARQILSAAYFQIGQVERALDATQEIIRLAPLDPITHYKSGILHQQRGSWRQAMDEFRTASRIAPHDSIEYVEAESAIESLDRQQMSIILTLAADDRLFQMRLARNASEASQERGFHLSTEASLYLQHLAVEHSDNADVFAPSMATRPIMYN